MAVAAAAAATTTMCAHKRRVTLVFNSVRELPLDRCVLVPLVAGSAQSRWAHVCVCMCVAVIAFDCKMFGTRTLCAYCIGGNVGVCVCVIHGNMHTLKRQIKTVIVGSRTRGQPDRLEEVK